MTTLRPFDASDGAVYLLDNVVYVLMPGVMVNVRGRLGVSFRRCLRIGESSSFAYGFEARFVMLSGFSEDSHVNARSERIA